MIAAWSGPSSRGTRQSLPEKGLSIAATVPAEDGIDIAGTASYVIGADAVTCEFATSVTDEWTGTGLGRVLMEALVETARARGLREMEGFVLADNQGMLALARRVGFTVGRHPDDYSLRVCRLAL